MCHQEEGVSVCLCLRVMAEFEQLPAHLTEQPHLFSMEDLLRVKKGQFMAQARALLHSAVDHVENCEVSTEIYLIHPVYFYYSILLLFLNLHDVQSIYLLPWVS